VGKQAKKKQKTGNENQKTHNKATRFMNTKKRGALWALRQVPVRNKKGVVQKDEDGNVITQTARVTVPPRTGWDIWDKNKNDPKKAQEPFDALHLDWREEMMEFAADNNARIGKIDQGNGVFLYQVYRDEPGPLGKRIVFFEVESSKKFTLEKQRRVRK
jgi:hypothetical protein